MRSGAVFLGGLQRSADSDQGGFGDLQIGLGLGGLRTGDNTQGLAFGAGLIQRAARARQARLGLFHALIVSATLRRLRGELSRQPLDLGFGRGARRLGGLRSGRQFWDAFRRRSDGGFQRRPVVG